MSTETKKVVKGNWVKRVMAILEITDEGKVGLMHNSLVKMLKKQIKIRKDEIARLKVQLEEQVEELTEVLDEITEDAETAFLTVSVGQIDSTSSRKEYAKVLNRNFDLALDRIEAKEKEIEDLKEDTAATIEAKEKEIARFELKLEKVA